MTLSTEHPAPTARRRDRARTSTAPDPFMVSALLSSPADAPQTQESDHAPALPLDVATAPGFTSGTASESVPATHGGRTYRVRKGDDLVNVAARFGVSVPALVDLNGLARRPQLRPGQILSLPERQVTDGPATHRAQARRNPPVDRCAAPSQSSGPAAGQRHGHVAAHRRGRVAQPVRHGRHECAAADGRTGSSVAVGPDRGVSGRHR